MLTGETREVRTTGGYVAPSVGDLALFGRAFPGTNIRDSDMAGSINISWRWFFGLFRHIYFPPNFSNVC